MGAPKDKPQHENEPKQTEDDMPDLDVSGQDAESVKGGITKQEFSSEPVPGGNRPSAR